jgi:uncharacterized protein YcfL
MKLYSECLFLMTIILLGCSAKKSEEISVNKIMTSEQQKEITNIKMQDDVVKDVEQVTNQKIDTTLHVPDHVQKFESFIAYNRPTLSATGGCKYH